MATKKYPNGVYEGDLVNGIPNGKGTFVLTDSGRKYVGEWKNGTYNGQGRFYYSSREYCDGTWKDGKPTGPFILMRNGLPHDIEYRGGEQVDCPISYGIETSPDRLTGKMIKCWHSNQSGFMIETPSATLIFDWYRSQLPNIRKDKPLHIFISHIHEDHFNSAILSLAEAFDDVSIYLGYERTGGQFDDYLDKLPDRIYDSISCFNGRQPLITDFGKVESLASTDLGVAFLVHVDGMTLFHAGDLFPWGGSDRRFKAFTAPLRGVHIDYAMLPMDPRFPDAAEQCIKHYLELADITFFTPMHLWDSMDYIGTFAKLNPQYCRKMIAINPQKASIRYTIEFMCPYTIQF